MRAAPRPTAGKSTRHPHTLWRSPPHPACMRPPIIPFVPNPLSSPRALTLPSTPPVLCLLLSYSDASHTSHGHNTPNTNLVLGSPQRPPHTAATQPADTTTFGALGPNINWKTAQHFVVSNTACPSRTTQQVSANPRHEQHIRVTTYYHTNNTAGQR